MNNYDNVISELERQGYDPEPDGSGHRAKCPGHGGKDRNLKLSRGNGAPVVAHCHSHKCPVRAIADGLGLPVSVFMSESYGDDATHFHRTPTFADADTRDRIYSATFKHLGLDYDDLMDLADRRGLGSELATRLAERAGYATLGAKRKRVAAQVAAEHPQIDLASVPGFRVTDDGLSIAGHGGLAIPVRDIEGRIVGVVTRIADDAKAAEDGRYRWWSSSAVGGPAAKLSVHHPIFDGPRDVVRITEGPLKADIATELSGVWTLGIPGVTAWQLAIDSIQQLGPSRVLIAMDSDFRTNTAVADAVVNLVRAVRKLGISVAVEIWDPGGGKGIDDLLVAGGVPTIIEDPQEIDELLATIGVRVESGPGIDWPDLIEAEDVPVPAFPVEVFPVAIAQFTRQISDTLQTPPDLAAFYAMAALSTAISRKFAVSIPSKSWTEPCNIYAVSVLDVGNRKSAACKLCTVPLVAYEADLRAESHQSVVNHNAKRRMLEAKLKSLETKAARLDGAQADKLIGEAQDISWELATMPIRTLPSMLCDDATPQALEATMHNNGERIALLSAEGGIFDILSGRWSKGQYDLDLILKSHCGDPCRTKRITRGEVVLQQPTITFGLSIQPEKLKGIAADRTFAGLGLLARFLWCVPTSTVGYRETRPPKLDPKVDAAYKNLVYELCAIPTPEDPLPMPLSPEAEAAHDRFQGAIERRLAPGRDLSGLHGWPNKLVGHCLRIAALLHFARHGRHGANHEIGTHDVNAAIQLCESYLIPHASKAFGIAHADDRVADAEWIRSWVRRHELAEFDRTTLHRDGQRRFYGDKLRLSAALDWMVGAGMLAILPEKARSVGRKPAPRYAVNPRILNPEKR